MRTMSHRGIDENNECRGLCSISCYYRVNQDCIGECVDRDDD